MAARMRSAEGAGLSSIGRGGSVLKQVGMEARQDIRELIGGKVHLELWVKVRENWTEDTAFLRELGMGAESL